MSNMKKIKTKLVTFVTDNVRPVGIVGDKNLLARMLQDKEQPHRREGTKKVTMRQQGGNSADSRRVRHNRLGDRKLKMPDVALAAASWLAARSFLRAAQHGG